MNGVVICHLADCGDGLALDLGGKAIPLGGADARANPQCRCGCVVSKTVLINRFQTVADIGKGGNQIWFWLCAGRVGLGSGADCGENRRKGDQRKGAEGALGHAASLPDRALPELTYVISPLACFAIFVQRQRRAFRLTYVILSR